MKIISLQNISKTYTNYAHGVDRLLEILTRRPHHQAFTALYPMNLDIYQGQIVGIIGNNGAGKSTLLKIVTGTLRTDTGQCDIKGRIAALLELGGGFHPDMTGRENAYLNMTMMGLPSQELDKKYKEVVDFAGISDFIDQPVKNYSSGMFMRLAFAVATCVEPDILIIDEALSVGDGAFARKSFDRIMQFKQAHKTILFCSHSLYQVEAICDRVVWLDKGHVKLDGAPSAVVSAYSQFLNQSDLEVFENSSKIVATTKGTARFTDITVSADGMTGNAINLLSLKSELCITIGFSSDSTLPSPTIGLVIFSADGRIVSSAGTHNDDFTIKRNAQGESKVRLVFNQFPLLKGEYWLVAYLLCEKAIHLYDQANIPNKLYVHQQSLELGIVSLPHHWTQI